MTADSLAMDASDLYLDLDGEVPSFLATLTNGAKWLGITGLTVTAATLFGMALAVILGVGTVVVAAIALGCVAVGAVLLVAALLLAAGLCVIGAGIALTLGVAGGATAALLGLLRWTGRGIGALFERYGYLRGTRMRMLQPSKSSPS